MHTERGDSLQPLFSAFAKRHGPTVPFLDELLTPLLGLGRRKRLHRGEALVAAGEIPRFSGLSDDGYFRSYVIDSRGEEATLSFERPGQFLASYTAMVVGEPSHLTLEALNDCEVFVMEASAFYANMLADPRWFRLCFEIQQADVFRRERREISLLTHPPRLRYQKFREEYGDLEEMLRNYQIASYLGIAPETLSRIRNRRLA